MAWAKVRNTVVIPNVVTVKGALTNTGVDKVEMWLEDTGGLRVRIKNRTVIVAAANLDVVLLA